MLRAPPVRTAEVRAGLGLGMGTCVLGRQGLEWAQLYLLPWRTTAQTGTCLKRAGARATD